MTPTLADGEFVLVDPAAPADIGDLVLAVHPDEADRLVVKRLTDRLADGRVMLLSDNPAGIDSRTWGPVDGAALRGRITLVLDRPFATTGRAGLGTAQSRPVRSRFGVSDLWRWLRR